MQAFIKKNLTRGIGMVEVVVGVTIITTSILAIIASYSLYLSHAVSNQRNVQSASLLEEGVEVMKFMRDASWAKNIGSMTNGTNYWLNFNGSTWATTTAQTAFIDGVFDRRIVVSAVNRDSDSDIVTSGGTVDTSTKKVTVSVAYKAKNGTTTDTLSTYITNLYAN